MATAHFKVTSDDKQNTVAIILNTDSMATIHLRAHLEIYVMWLLQTDYTEVIHLKVISGNNQIIVAIKLLTDSEAATLFIVKTGGTHKARVLTLKNESIATSHFKVISCKIYNNVIITLNTDSMSTIHLNLNLEVHTKQ